ncbi:amidohydrolase family protein [Devosia sp. A369]
MNGDIGPDQETKWKRWGYPKPDSVPLPDYVRSMDENGISVGVFTGREIIRDGAIKYGIPNDYIGECCQQFPDRIIGLSGLDMAEGEKAAELLGSLVQRYGFRGAALDPRMSATHIDDRQAYPIYEKAAELGMPVVFTMGPFVGNYSDPYRIDRVALDFPKVNFVCSHSPWPQVNDYLALCYRRLNVYLEPSLYWSLPGNDAFFEAANGFLNEQVVYASGHPLNPLFVVEKFRKRFDWSQESWEKVSHGNAARLLGLAQD